MGSHDSDGLAATPAAILVAAGSGARMGAPVPKALVPLAGRPLLAWSLAALAASAEVDAIVVAAPADRVSEAEAVVRAQGAPGPSWRAAPAAPSRSRRAWTRPRRERGSCWCTTPPARC